MTDNKKNFLDELEEDQQKKQAKQQQDNEQISEQVKVLNTLIEKMEGYATKIREKGFEVRSGETKKIEWHPDTGTVIFPSKGPTEIIEGYMFATREEKHGEETNKETQKLVSKYFRKYVSEEEVTKSIFSGIDDRTYNPLSQRMIILRPTTNGIIMYWDWTYSADVIRYGKNFLSRGNAVSLNHGNFTLKVDGFSDSDIENCFEFLLGKSESLFLSSAAGGGCLSIIMLLLLPPGLLIGVGLFFWKLLFR